MEVVWRFPKRVPNWPLVRRVFEVPFPNDIFGSLEIWRYLSIVLIVSKSTVSRSWRSWYNFYWIGTVHTINKTLLQFFICFRIFLSPFIAKYEFVSPSVRCFAFGMRVITLVFVNTCVTQKKCLQTLSEFTFELTGPNFEPTASL